MNNPFKKIAAITYFLFLFSIAFGLSSEKYEYRYAKGDTIHYSLSSASSVSFIGLESLARLFNLDNITNNSIIWFDLLALKSYPDGSARMKMIINTVSMINVVGDSVMSDDGSQWGQYKAGNEFTFRISPAGEISDVACSDTTFKDDRLLLEQFMPVFPDHAIDIDDDWIDTSHVNINISKHEQIKLQSVTNYVNERKLDEDSGAISVFSYKTEGNSGQRKVDYTGSGSFTFDNDKQQLADNISELKINAVLDVSEFGLPIQIDSGIPVLIETTVKLRRK